MWSEEGHPYRLSNKALLDHKFRHGKPLRADAMDLLACWVSQDLGRDCMLKETALRRNELGMRKYAGRSQHHVDRPSGMLGTVYDLFRSHILNFPGPLRAV